MSLKSKTKEKNKSVYRIKRLKENLQAYVLMLPSLILFFALSIYPIIWSMKYCFYDYDGVSAPLFVGLENFKQILNFKEAFANPTGFYAGYWLSWGRTLVYVLIKTGIEMPLAFFCAYVIYRKVKGAAFFKALFYLPQILPGMVLSLVFLIMLMPSSGPLNNFMYKLGLIEQNYAFFAHQGSAFMTGLLVDVWFTFGLNMLLFIAGFANVSREILESADVDGANEFEKTFFVTLPMMGRIVQIIVMLSIIGSLKTIGSYFILTQGGPNHGTELTFLYIYNLFFGVGANKYGYGAAVAIVSAVIIGIITVIYNKLTSKFLYD
jgi:raffinose/stachyose/melibiose transport system permease protein